MQNAMRMRHRRSSAVHGRSEHDLTMIRARTRQSEARPFADQIYLALETRFVWKIMAICAAAKSIHIIQNHRIAHLPRNVTSQDYEAVRMCSFSSCCFFFLFTD